MHGKHSTAAFVVAMDGPNGPQYHPEVHPAEWAEALVNEIRSTGVTAVAMPLHLRMPDPGPLLIASVPPGLFAVVHDDPFDLIEAEVRAAMGHRGDSTAAPAAGAGDSDEPEEFDESHGEADPDADDTEEMLGDESTYIGWASFERILNQWTVWLAFVDQGSTPQLTAAFPTLDEAWKEAERWRNDPEYSDWVAIIVGPGEGPLALSAITAWPDKWTIITAKETESGDGWTVDYSYPDQRDDFAREIADCYREPSPGVCQVVVAPYRPAAQGGER